MKHHRGSERAPSMAPPFSSLLEVTGNTVIWLFLASLVPLLFPLLAICSSLVLIVLFPLACGFVSLLVFRKLSSAILAPLKRLLPSWLSLSAPLAWLPWHKNAAASLDRCPAEGSPYAPLDPVKVEEVHDGQDLALPAPPASPSETSDVCCIPRTASSASLDGDHREFTEAPASPSETSDVGCSPKNAQSASLDEEPLLDHREVIEEPSFRGPTPTSQVETANGIPPTTSSFFSEADNQQQIARETAQDDEEEPSFYESTEELAPFEPDTYLGERFEEISTPESRPILDPGSQVLEYPDVAATGKTDSVSSVPLESALHETTEAREAEGVSNSTTLPGSDKEFFVSRNEDFPSSSGEFSAEDVFCECKPTSNDPDWEDEGTSDREVEGMTGTDVADSHIEQASELLHEPSDVAQPIDVEPMDRSLLEHTEGSQPTAAESIMTFGGVSESGIESLEEKDKEELPGLSAEDVSGECKPTSVHPDWEDEGTSDREVERMPGTDVLNSHIEQASESRHGTSDVAQPIDVGPVDRSLPEHTEGSQPTAAESITTCGGVSESRIESLEDEDKAELPELSAEDVSGECKPTLVHSDWEDEGTSDREVEGMLGTDVPDSHIEQASELRHKTSDVAQPTDVEPMNHGLLEHTEGSQPTPAESMTAFGGVPESGVESLEEKDKEELRELSSEDVSGEYKPTSVHPDWEDEGSSDREVEGMPGTDVPDSHIAQASELRHETSDVAQPIDVEPMDHSLLERTKGSQPTAAESIATFGGVSESGIESLKEKDKEELPGLSAEDVSGECNPTSVHPDWEDEDKSDRELEGMPGTDVLDSHIKQTSELRHETSDVAQPIDVEPVNRGLLEHTEGSQPTAAESRKTFDGVSESGIKSLEEKDKDELPKLSAEDVFVDCKPTPVHPDWKDEDTSDREVEGMPGTDVPDSHIEQASELRHETSDVAQTIDVEPIERSLLEHTEGSQPTAAGSRTTFGGVSESDIESLEEKDKEELPELSAEDVSGECKPTLVHPDWEHEGTRSDHEVEEMPETDVPDSHIEQATELQHETSDVTQPIDVEPMDRSLLEHPEGSQPAAAESIRTFGGVSESRIEALEEKDKEDKAPSEPGLEFAVNRSSYANGEELYPGAEAGAAESDIKSSEDEMSRASLPTFGDVSDSEIESLEEKDKEDDSKAETSSRATSVLETIKEPTGNLSIKVTSSKELNMWADIDAIKKIVGYRGDPRGGLGEQIRTLYLYVGMEPSSFVVKADDLEKAWEELEVLKKVIGLK